jgi:hypothetical protein
VNAAAPRPAAIPPPAAAQPAAAPPPAPAASALPRVVAPGVQPAPAVVGVAPAAPEVPAAPAAPAAVDGPPGGEPGRDLADGWRHLLQSLNVKTRAYFSEARPQLEGDCLVLVFPYSFHHKQAVDSAGQVEPLLKAWLGASARLDLRLQDASPRPAQAVAARTLAPEEDPVIKAAERKLEAKVVRVRPLKEAP